MDGLEINYRGDNGTPGTQIDQVPNVQFGAVSGHSSGGLAQPQQQQSAAPVYVDPYAQWGGRAAYDSLRAQKAAQKSGIYSSSRDAATNAGIGYNSSILDLIDSTKSAQNKINSQGAQNELAKRQGTLGVQGMVGRGIKSGGVMLANKNASDSSAAGAIARAYGDLGRRELSNVGNQYAKGNMEIQDAQVDLEGQRATGIRKIGESKQTMINSIVSEARNQLAQLDADIANASLPDRINIEQEKEAIRNEALAQLQGFDAKLTEGMAGITPNSVEERRSKALMMASEGQAPESAFQYTQQAPAMMQGTGPMASNLPIFTFKRGRTE